MTRTRQPRRLEGMFGLEFWRAIYRCALVVAYPAVHLRLKKRARREPEYAQRIEERFGRVPETLSRGPIWFHTVSAGETIAAAPLIAELKSEFSDLPFLVTTMTPTGYAQVASRLGELVEHCYAPYDFPAVVEKFYDSVQPRLLVLMETELWPNMLRTAAQRKVPALLVNARLSARSAKGYSRIRPLVKQMLAELKFIACQYHDHAERFLALGAPAASVGALGSVKFDVRLSEDHAIRVARIEQVWQLQGRSIWIAGSTHAGEETVVLDAHQAVRDRLPDTLLILVPRHPARCDEVADMLEKRGVRFARQSENPDDALVEVLLIDTMGQLQYLYGLSQVAFLGGSLVSVGGHNPIEAAVCGQPLLMGPETFNFPDVVAEFSDAGCLRLVTDAVELADSVLDYLTDPILCERAGKAARQVVEANRGATGRILDLLRAEIRASATDS